MKAGTTAGRRGYNYDQEEEDGLEEASRILTLDDFAPNYHQSAKPLSPARTQVQHPPQVQEPQIISNTQIANSS